MKILIHYSRTEPDIDHINKLVVYDHILRSKALIHMSKLLIRVKIWQWSYWVLLLLGMYLLEK